MYQVEHVANSIIYASRMANQTISLMKLQRLLYLLYAEYYKLTDKPLFNIGFETWTYGPAIEKLYYAYTGHFGRNTTKDIRTYIPDPEGYLKKTILSPYENDDYLFLQAWNKIWNVYGDRSGIELCQITRTQDSAWYKAVKNGQRFLNDEDIKQEAYTH